MIVTPENRLRVVYSRLRTFPAETRPPEGYFPFFASILFRFCKLLKSKRDKYLQ